MPDHPSKGVEHDDPRKTLAHVERYGDFIDLNVDGIPLEFILQSLDGLRRFKGSSDPDAHVSQKLSDKRTKGSLNSVAVDTNSHGK